VIGNRNRRHIHFSGAFGNVLDAIGTIEQRVLGMNVQMAETTGTFRHGGNGKLKVKKGNRNRRRRYSTRQAAAGLAYSCPQRHPQKTARRQFPRAAFIPRVFPDFVANQ
jgi:hypothetical protein